MRGLVSEVPVGGPNGLDRDSVINVDDIVTVEQDRIGPLVDQLLDEQEPALTAAIVAAFELRVG